MGQKFPNFAEEKPVVEEAKDLAKQESEKLELDALNTKLEMLADQYSASKQQISELESNIALLAQENEQLRAELTLANGKIALP